MYYCAATSSNKVDLLDSIVHNYSDIKRQLSFK